MGVASLIGVSLGIALLRVVDAKKHRYALVALYALVIAAMIQKLLD